MPKPSIVMSTRVISGVAGIVVAAVTLAAVAGVSLPTVAHPPTAVTVTPVPTPARLVCPGSVLRLGDIGGENATTAIPIGQPRYSSGATAGSPVSAPLLPNGAEATGGEPTLVTGDESDASIAAAEWSDVDAGDYHGLAAAECAAPSSDVWLVGGATNVGRTTLLTLANPGAVASTVAIEIAGGEGLIEAPGLTGITVPAGGQRSLSIAGFAPNLAQLAVHVTSRGGPISAHLQQSVVRGIEPGGVDVVGATAVPNTLSVIPGVVVLAADAVEGRLGETGFDDLVTTLRLYAPGEAAAQVTVQVVPEVESTTGGSFQLSLQPGIVTDVPIESLADGSYTVVVESSAPVLAAVRAATVAPADSEATDTGETTGGASDLAWFAAATGLGESAFASVAPGQGARLHLANPGDAPITATINGQSVTVEAGGALAIDVGAGQSILLEGAEGLFASISFAEDGKLASYLISSGANVELPVLIYP